MSSLKVGITGGIGSGKTSVCKIFEVLGIPVFYADDAAKTLMNEDLGLRAAIIQKFGPEVYPDGKLNRAALSKKIFGDKEALQTLNDLVHPATVAASKQWFEKQTSLYALKEAAIFFESGTYKDIDLMIGISSPLALRLSRSMARTGMSEEEVRARMSQQMDDAEKMSRCDFVIVNDEEQAVLPQVLALHKVLLERVSAVLES
ncbi:MAG: dephospho-CoA kinase [Chitinophagaceae bacterium]